MKYNDVSVLENMHAANLFKLTQYGNQNIFANFGSDDFVSARKLIIEMILVTDMSKHFESLNNFKHRALTLEDLKMTEFDDRLMVLKLGLKCSDLGHSAKSTELHHRWSLKVCDEFFLQGDRERDLNLEISMFCDRNTTDVNKSQLGFLTNICLPLYDTWSKYLKSDAITTMCRD
jgi:hypothetical protein